MKNHVKPITPRCGICHRLYAVKDNNGTGLCLKCRTANVLPDINIKPKYIKVKGEQSMKEFDELEVKEVINTEEVTAEPNLSNTTIIEQTITPEVTENTTDTNNGEVPEEVPQSSIELKIEDVIEFGKRGVTNLQMLNALKPAIDGGSIEKVVMLKKHYPKVFADSFRYLKRKQREFIEVHKAELE